MLVHRRSSPESPTFDVHRKMSKGGAVASPLLPGFSLAVAELFAR